MLEQDLEDFLAINAYLIDPVFDGIKPEQQLSRGKHRLDLLFRRPTVDTIVELKRTPITIAALQQLERYYQEWSAVQKLSKTHFLVGLPPSAKEAKAIQDYGRQLPFRIILRRLGVDIPLRLLYDENTRRYIPYDPEKARITVRYSHTKEFQI